jgi:drug/metabolite transporter (DMT)-like permease
MSNHTPSQTSTKITDNQNWVGFANLFVVYIVWGSTYLAIRVTVKDDGGFAPFILGLTRVITGGSLLLLWGKLRKERLRPTREEILTLLVTGCLLWVGGNGLVVWAEQRAESGLASLMLAATPIWIALIEAIIDRKLPTGRLTAALLVGFSGIAVLTAPNLKSGFSADAASIFALLLAGLSWGAGSIYQSRRPTRMGSVVNAGYQQVVGAIGFSVLVFISGETWSPPDSTAWMAWGYLVIFGSLLAFTSYLRAIELLPMKVVATYSYVNPVIAVFLGWLILGEKVTPWVLGGAALVLLGVMGVFQERTRLRRLQKSHSI